MGRKNMPPGPGRPKGLPNKITTELKAMIRDALDGVGGQAYLERQAQDNPNAFLTLLGKTVPSDVNAKLSGAIKVDGSIRFIRPDDKL